MVFLGSSSSNEKSRFKGVSVGKKTLVMFVCIVFSLTLVFAIPIPAQAQPLYFDQANANGFGIPTPADNMSAQAMAVLEGNLYTGTVNPIDGCQVWRYDSGTNWTQVNTNGFGTTNNQAVSSMAVLGKKLYLGTLNPLDGCQLWRYDGGNDWTQVNTSGFGTANNLGINSIHGDAKRDRRLPGVSSRLRQQLDPSQRQRLRDSDAGK